MVMQTGQILHFVQDDIQKYFFSNLLKLICVHLCVRRIRTCGWWTWFKI